jgi:hypothetical protein
MNARYLAALTLFALAFGTANAAVTPERNQPERNQALVVPEVQRADRAAATFAARPWDAAQPRPDQEYLGQVRPQRGLYADPTALMGGGE